MTSTVANDFSGGSLFWFGMGFFFPKHLRQEKTSEGIIFLDPFAKTVRKNGLCCPRGFNLMDYKAVGQ